MNSETDPFGPSPSSPLRTGVSKHGAGDVQQPARDAAQALDRRYFNRYADGYSPYTADDLQLMLGDLLAAAGARRVERVCEVGCADGQFSSELARQLGSAVQFTGLDIADLVLRKYPFGRLCGSAFTMPCHAASFDLVCYAASLHHLAPFEAALSELARVLTPDGLAYFLEPNMLHPQRRLFVNHPRIYRWYRDANDTPVHPYALRALLNRFGFDTVALRFLTIAFSQPGRLQRLQNRLSALPWPARLRPYVSPWFVLIARRRP
jgi:SAM-dependent methyltransferase